MLRFAELGKAVIKRLLSSRRAKPEVRYFGVHFEMKECKVLMEKDVYSHWDQDPSSPPMQRSREPVAAPNLTMLQWGNDMASFPPSILEKFAVGTSQHGELLKFKGAVEEMYPPVSPSQHGSRGTGRAPRAGGRPDFSIEGGVRPIDVAREVDLLKIRQDDFNEERPDEDKKQRTKDVVSKFIHHCFYSHNILH